MSLYKELKNMKPLIIPKDLDKTGDISTEIQKIKIIGGQKVLENFAKVFKINLDI